VGLWDVVKSVGKAVVEEGQKRVEKVERSYEKYSGYSDERLKEEVKKVKSGDSWASNEEKMGLAKAAKERGIIR
jgi:hypothetical protein